MEEAGAEAAEVVDGRVVAEAATEAAVAATEAAEAGRVEEAVEVGRAEEEAGAPVEVAVTEAVDTEVAHQQSSRSST